MSPFTVPSELCQAQFQWTGVQASFPCGFPADEASDLLVQYQPNAGGVSTLPLGVAYTVTLDPVSGDVTIVVVAMPDNGPGIVTVTRNTPATQSTQFNNLDTYQADPITALFSQMAMIGAECKRRLTALEEVAFGAPVPPANFTTGVRAQRSIKSAADLPIRSTDSILNILIAAPLAITAPLATTRVGAPLTFKNLSGSTAVATINATAPDNFDALPSVPLAPGAELTGIPANDGVNSGYAIG